MPSPEPSTPVEPASPPESEAPSRSRSTRSRLGVGAAIVLALVVLSAAVGLGLLRGRSAPSESVAWGADTASPSADGEIYVHVLGAVSRPGLYVLRLDARLVDAVAAAGGATGDADLAGVNLARPLTDGEQIVVPGVGGAGAEASAPTDGRIDLNAADQAALESLPRIGPALAQRIIAWREENGGFRAVDDLLSVPGIGEKLLSGIRDGVRV